MENFNVSLKKWLDSLGRLDRMRASREICRTCKVEKRKLYNWTNAGVRVEPLYQDKIREVKDSFK